MGMRKKAALTLLGTGLVAGIGLSMFDALMIYVPIVVAVLSLTDRKSTRLNSSHT